MAIEWKPHITSMRRKAEYINPGSKAIKLVGPDGNLQTIGPGEKIIRDDWFNRYVPRQLRFVRYLRTDGAARKPVRSRFSIKQSDAARASRSKRRTKAQQLTEVRAARKAAAEAAKKNAQQRTARVNNRPSRVRARTIRSRPNRNLDRSSRRIVGRSSLQQATAYRAAKSAVDIPLSNNIGVGILSFNRPDSLKRLINSIKQHTDLSRTSIFVSDESDKNVDLAWLANDPTITLIRGPRLGVAGNSNRLLKCLDRFKYKLLLNDDVEVLGPGWESFYFSNMKKTGLHHFCYREPGVYGAKEGELLNRGGVDLMATAEKPHGAVMAIHDSLFQKIGFFDEGFGLYGMEHVDWSERAAVSTKQKGFYDVKGSNRFFRIHSDRSVVPDRVAHLGVAKQRYQNVRGKRTRVEASSKSDVPSMSVIIPFRDNGRSESLASVVSNMRGMRFPRLEIIVVEQDHRKSVSPEKISPSHYHHLAAPKGQHFHKAIAFNKGVSHATHDHLILQDADILVPGHYMEEVWAKLQRYDSCHLGKRVFYLDPQGTNLVNRDARMPAAPSNRCVTYFEGGSLGCTRAAYKDVGGFDEAYVGYGCEDCCFYERLAKLTKFSEDRRFDFFHLDHGRTPGWEACHKRNKTYYMNVRKGKTLREYANGLANTLRTRWKI